MTWLGLSPDGPCSSAAFGEWGGALVGGRELQVLQGGLGPPLGDASPPQLLSSPAGGCPASCPRAALQAQWLRLKHRQVLRNLGGGQQRDPHSRCLVEILCLSSPLLSKGTLLTLPAGLVETAVAGASDLCAFLGRRLWDCAERGTEPDRPC